MIRFLEFVRFLGVSKTGQCADGGVAIHLDLDGFFGLGADRLQPADQLRHDLADLDLACGHDTNVFRIAGAVNKVRAA